MNSNCSIYRDYCCKILCNGGQSNNCQCKGAYAYIYLLKTDEDITIIPNNSIPFNKNGELKGISHDTTNNPGEITIQDTGYYEVTFYLLESGKESLAIYLNNIEISGSRYIDETGSSILYGQVIAKVDKINSILEVVNTDTQNLVIKKLNPSDDPLAVRSSIYIEKIDNL